MKCQQARVGWFCTRDAGHDGPCAEVRRAPAPLPDRTVDMGRTPCPPAIATADPKWLTCCLAIKDDGSRVCRDTKGHDGPHDWERPKEKA